MFMPVFKIHLQEEEGRRRTGHKESDSEVKEGLFREWGGKYRKWGVVKGNCR